MDETPTIDRDDPIWLEVYSHASVAAARTHRRFHRWVSHDDLRSAALEYAWRRRDKVAEFLLRDTEEERRRGVRALIKTLQRASERYARKEKANRVGYEVFDEYFYSEAIVESLILAWGRGEVDATNQVMDPAEFGGKRTKKPANEGNDLLAMLADIDRAMKALDARTYGILYSRIVQDIKAEDVAAAWDISHQRVAQIHKRGILDLIDHLGGLRPY